jgi:hypothetical protein
MTIADNDTSTVGMQKVIELRCRLAKLDPTRTDLTKIEEDVRAALDEVGRELMSTAFAAADIDDQEILVNGELHGKVDRRPVELHTTFGGVKQEQSVYGRGRGHPTVVPMEKMLGLVEHLYTPKCARVLLHLTAVTVHREAVELLQEFGGIGVGEATVHRLPLAAMARYERDRDIIERAVRQRSTVPSEAAIMQVGLDGVMVPMDGEHCDPRGRETDGDPDPPRHERRYGIVTEPGPAASDGYQGVAWHEASVGTISFFDADGDHLSTIYVGRMPEEKKATLGETLCDEVLHALEQRPDLIPVLASDGALGQWETIADITVKMPEAARSRAVWLLDFFHAAEHLQEACDAIDGKGSARANVRRHELAETLKQFPDGVERVLQRLAHYRRQARSDARRDRIDAVIGYMQNNRHRMAYHAAIARNLPIATGPTEAAAKCLVGTRMKRSGARFSQHGGQTVLTLRAALKSARFGDLFDVLTRGYKGSIKRPRAA